MAFNIKEFWRPKEFWGVDGKYKELTQTYGEGEVILREGDTSKEMYIIHEGEVRVTKMIAGNETELGPADESVAPKPPFVLFHGILESAFLPFLPLFVHHRGSTHASTPTIFVDSIAHRRFRSESLVDCVRRGQNSSRGLEKRLPLFTWC